MLLTRGAECRTVATTQTGFQYSFLRRVADLAANAEVERQNIGQGRVLVRERHELFAGEEQQPAAALADEVTQQPQVRVAELAVFWIDIAENDRVVCVQLVASREFGDRGLVLHREVPIRVAQKSLQCDGLVAFA